VKQQGFQWSAGVWEKSSSQLTIRFTFDGGARKRQQQQQIQFGSSSNRSRHRHPQPKTEFVAVVPDRTSSFV